MTTVIFQSGKHLRRLIVSGNANITAVRALSELVVEDRKVLNLSQYKRGKGGRSSFSGNVVTVFGPSGSLGSTIINRLGKEGSNVILPVRGENTYQRHMKMMGDLGQIIYHENFDARNEELIKNALKRSNLVINLIGTNRETANWTFSDVHVDVAARIARLCRQCNVDRLIHFSALNASPDPQKIYLRNGSGFLKSKYAGEQAVKDEFPDVVIVRPGTIYGERDLFLSTYMRFERYLTEGLLPLWHKGERTIKRPLHQSDLTDALMKIVHSPDIRGVTYDFAGPKAYLLSELTDYMVHVMRRDVTRIPTDFLTRLKVTFSGRLFKHPLLHPETFEREFISDRFSDDPSVLKVTDLIDKFREFEDVVPWHLKNYRAISFYEEKLGEFAAPKPPVPLSDDYEHHIAKRLEII